jgi:protein SCO1/2
MSSNHHRPSATTRLALVAACAVAALAARAADDAAVPAPHDMASMAGMDHAGEASDPHAAHRHMMANNEIRRSVANYSIPALHMVRADGAGVSLDRELNDGRPVVMNFIYTTCTTICPLSSQVFSMLQERLGPDRRKVHLVSISIDPEQDTPARLATYAQRFHADTEWQHYTGTLNASIEAQRAFGVFRGDKMNHTPVTLLRAAPGGQWVRLDGFATADDLLAELREFKAPPGG